MAAPPVRLPALPKVPPPSTNARVAPAISVITAADDAGGARVHLAGEPSEVYVVPPPLLCLLTLPSLVVSVMAEACVMLYEGPSVTALSARVAQPRRAAVLSSFATDTWPCVACPCLTEPLRGHCAYN